MSTSEPEPAASSEDVNALLHERSNWGRWGEDDQLGALNLITARKRVDAARLVRTGTSVSLSKALRTQAAVDNPHPAQHYTTSAPRGSGGIATDFYGVEYHGRATTHLDALCHVWDERGMWNGRNPQEELTGRGSRWGGIEHWRHGIFTRGLLIDVPRHRGVPYVSHERPITGQELEDICARQGIDPAAGDAVFVYSGREAWDAHMPPWGSETDAGGRTRRPGLDASCLRFLRDHDVAVLGWDMLDAAPNPPGVPWTVHGAIFAFGVALIDNCELSRLADLCATEERYEFLLTAAPLVAVGGTGSPVNPIATF